MQDAETVSVGYRGEDEVDGRQPVMPSEGELALRIDRATLYSLVHRDMGKSKQLFEQLVVIAGAPG